MLESERGGPALLSEHINETVTSFSGVLPWPPLPFWTEVPGRWRRQRQVLTHTEQGTGARHVPSLQAALVLAGMPSRLSH